MSEHETIRLLNFDFNWSLCEYAPGRFQHTASGPMDWAYIDPVEYVDWHEQHGNTAVLCQAYTQPGTALYPSRFGPVAPGPGSDLCLRIAEETDRRGMQFWSYFSVGCEVMHASVRPHWCVPGSQKLAAYADFFAPETPWTDLLCARIDEFLRQCPQTT